VLQSLAQLNPVVAIVDLVGQRKRQIGEVLPRLREPLATDLSVLGEFPNTYQVSNRLRIPRADVDALRERKRVRPGQASMYEPAKPSRARPTSGSFAAHLQSIRGGAM
jgi:hypothetical protein